MPNLLIGVDIIFLFGSNCSIMRYFTNWT